jgi:hypothetical protein
MPAWKRWPTATCTEANRITMDNILFSADKIGIDRHIGRQKYLSQSANLKDSFHACL